jgi:predicted negative regulator of RcsB-dependent stress response
MRKLVLVAVVALVPSLALAQGAPVLKTPVPSSAAKIEQTVGLTVLSVDYHRPAVNGRKIWGELVPYGQVWRAGANENTTFTTSSALKVQGKPLAAGTYGLHMLPTANDWTIIFNKVNTGWGSFSYDQKDDALRVTVHPTATGDSEERLSYRFDDPTDKSATMVLRWEKLAVPVKIEVDTPLVVMNSMRGELKGLAQFFYEPWVQAANYWTTNGGNLDEAQRFADKSLTFGPHFRSLRARATVAEKKGDKNKAEALRGEAMKIAEEGDLNNLGYFLMAQKKVDEAIAIFAMNVKNHPQSWNVFDSLAEALALKGDKPAAVENYTRALAMVKDDANRKRINLLLTKLK